MTITSSVADARLVIQCPERFDSEAAAEIVKEAAAKAGEVSAVVLDFKPTEHFETLVLLRCLGSLGKFLRSQSKDFFGINASPEIGMEIRINGLDSTVRLVTEAELGVQNKKKRPPNVELINPFILSTIKTLETQCATEPKCAERPFIKGSRPLPPIEIAGIIGVTSPLFKGAITIAFPKETFLGIMSNMLGEPQKEITRDLEDGAAELLNIIFGQSKVILNEKGFGIEKALPTVVRAPDLNIRQYSQSPVIVLPFDSTCGAFFMEIVTEE
jgi:chemotaxis protein CheX